jgi:hypothetical protein
MAVKDITVRAKISDYFKNTALTSLPYEIQDGERPETLAHRVYDRADLHWVILMFNEIHDPTFEWPLSSAELESKLQAKYKGYALYYPDSARIPDVFQLQPHITVLQQGGTISQTLADGTVITANIIEWNPTYNCIVVDGEQASLFDPYSDSPIHGGSGAWVYVNGDPSRSILLTKIVPYEYAVHHFEDSDGNVLDPRTIPAYQPNTLARSILEYYTSDAIYNLTETVAMPIDNRTQEFKDNDSKRSIRMVKPEFMSSIVTQFRSLFE